MDIKGRWEEERAGGAIRLAGSFLWSGAEATASGARRDDSRSVPYPSAWRGILCLVHADAPAQGAQQPADDPYADGGPLRRRHPRQHGQPAHRAADRARALQARAGHQGRRLHQVFRRPEADLRQVDDHPRRRALAENPHAAAAGVPPRHVRRVHPLLPGRHPHQDGQLGQARPERRDGGDGGADLDARRRHDLQGAVRPRDAVQSALRVQVREDLHRRDEPQVDPPQEGGRRGVRDHGGGRGQGDGRVGRRAARGVRRRSAERSASARF